MGNELTKNPYTEKDKDEKAWLDGYAAGQADQEQKLIEAYDDTRRLQQQIKDIASGLITFADLGIDSPKYQYIDDAQREITKLVSEQKKAISEIVKTCKDGNLPDINMSLYTAGLIDGQVTNHKRHGEKIRKAIAEAEKKGARELAEWCEKYLTEILCREIWRQSGQSKLKEL